MSETDWLSRTLKLWRRRGALNEDERRSLEELLGRFLHPSAWDDALQYFWDRLDELGEQEWVLCYELIRRVLKGEKYAQYRSLSRSADDCIQDYITAKVFEPARRRAGHPIHVNALRIFYRNYLNSLIRAEKPFSRGPIEIETEDGSIINILDYLFGVPGAQCDGKTREWIDRLESTPDVETSLEDMGLDPERVEASARQLLSELSALEDDHARILLRCHFCAAKGEAVPVMHFKAVFRNHYQRAQRLGIVPGGKQIPDYRTTRIGRWLTSEPGGDRFGLGLKLEPEYRNAVEAALTILCRATLSSVEIDCESYRKKSDEPRDDD